jgi:hypothetical protein
MQGYACSHVLLENATPYPYLYALAFGDPTRSDVLNERAEPLIG